MIRAVLDANVFVSALIRPQGPPGRVLRVWLEGAFELITSKPIVEEVRRCLNYPKIRRRLDASDDEIELWLLSLELASVPVSPRDTMTYVAADPDDDKYVSAAFEGCVDTIVTGDRHLLDLTDLDEIQITTPREFLDRLRSE